MVLEVKSKHVYLNLFLIDFPVTAITSIIHRVTGVILFIFIPFILYFFYLSIESSSSFIIAKSILSNFYVFFALKIFFISFIYHTINGIKHMIMDLGFFESKDGSRLFSIISLLIILIFSVLSLFYDYIK